MSKSSFYRWTSAIFAATYLVVGATGDSLYYLIESPAIDLQLEDLERGHFHDHGDGRWHYHGQYCGDRATASKKSAYPDKEIVDRDTGDPPARFDNFYRHDHTTFLLAVVSAIELSLLAGLPALSDVEAHLPMGQGDGVQTISYDLASLGPRGPPGHGPA